MRIINEIPTFSSISFENKQKIFSVNQKIASSSTSQMQSLAEKPATTWRNFLDFSLTFLEMTYRFITGIFCIPFSHLKDLYLTILNYNREVEDPLTPYIRIKELKINIPELSEGKKTEFEEIYKEFASLKPNAYWKNLSVEDQKTAHLNFIHCLDYFLDTFDAQIKKQKMPDVRINAQVLGLSYSIDVKRKEFLKMCLKKHIENPDGAYSTSQYEKSHPNCYARCSGFIPSYIGWVDSWSFHMGLSHDFETKQSYIRYEGATSYHWTLKNAEVSVKKNEFRFYF